MPELVYDAHRDEWRYASSTQENTASVNGCGCMCHVGSGTRTSCEHCSQRRGNQCLVCFDHGDSSGSGELVAAHIGCIRDLEARIEQLEIRDKMRDDGEHSLMGEIEARDVRIAQIERERGVEETNAQRWMTEAEDWKVRAEAAEQRVCELEERVRESERQLRELLASEPEDIDPRLDYLYLQVDRNAVTAARAFLQREEKT